MKVILDGIIYSLQNRGGISVYFNELLARLNTATTAAELVTFLPRPGAPPEANVQHTVRRSRLFERYRRFVLPGPGGMGTIFHSSYYRRPTTEAIPSVVTVHDFAYERCMSGPRRWVHSNQKFSAIRAAQAIICISNATREDLCELVGVREGQSVSVIYNGVSNTFRSLPHSAPGRPFLLFVGQRGLYKNFGSLLRCLARLPDFELRCVGGGAFSPREFTGVGADVRSRVLHEGPVGDTRLNVLYNQATCLVYPSSYEGFGIPVAEAMKVGCPVVCIDCKAVREVGGAAMFVAASLAPEDLSDAILRACSTSERYHHVQSGLEIAGRYSWDKTFNETCNVYRMVST